MIKLLTPHPIKISSQTAEVTIQMDREYLARVRPSFDCQYDIEGIPAYDIRDLDIKGLPRPRDDVTFVASSFVALVAALSGRTDVYAPNTYPGHVTRNIYGGVDTISSIVSYRGVLKCF